MENEIKPLRFWVENLSIYSVFAIIKEVVTQRRRVEIRFVKSSKIAYMIINFIKILHIIQIDLLKEAKHSLGDMYQNGSIVSQGTHLRYVLPKMSSEILSIIKTRNIYKAMTKIFSENKVDVCFEMMIRNEIFEIVRLLLIVFWHKKQDKVNDFILCPNSAIFAMLKQIQPYENIQILTYYNINIRSFFKKKIKLLIRAKRLMVGGTNSNLLRHKSSIYDKKKIAIHYAEGIDLKKRSDIFWYHKSNINHDSIILYFDLNKSKKTPLSDDFCRQVEDMGIRWVSLDKKAMHKPKKYKWKNICNFDSTLNRKINELREDIRNSIDKWIFISIKLLMVDVQRWVAFYKYFNIKIVSDVGVQSIESNAQSIALNIVDGVRIGFQRSAVSMTECIPFLRYNSNQLFFVWGKEVEIHRGTSNAIKNIIISGYPFDRIFYSDSSNNSVRNELKRRDVKFTIALFDNAFSNNYGYSKNIMTKFYSKFLEWLIQDKEIAIVVKEKKSLYLNQLRGVHDLLYEAKKTGRFIRLENVLGRLPSDASRMADVSVGIGISSAITEIVIAGYKGIHCDLEGHQSHPFYRLGYEKIIFNDIDRLIIALKQYKEDPENEPKLGDWSFYIDTLDPFRDGRGGERVGSYIHGLLESFDKKESRDEAIQYANNLYTRQWGEDKVIDMTN